MLFGKFDMCVHHIIGYKRFILDTMNIKGLAQLIFTSRTFDRQIQTENIRDIDDRWRKCRKLLL